MHIIKKGFTGLIALVALAGFACADDLVMNKEVKHN